MGLQNGFHSFRPYVPEDLTRFMVPLCREQFDGKHPGNVQESSKVLFQYIRESIHMLLNAKELSIWTITTVNGQQTDLIIIRPDLHHKSGDELFLVTIKNDLDESGNERKTKWKIQYLMTMQQLTRWLYLQKDQIPKSSRRNGSTLKLWQQIECHPENVVFDEVNSENLDRLKRDDVKSALNRKCKERECGCRGFKVSNTGSLCAHCNHSAKDHGFCSGETIEKTVRRRITREDLKRAVEQSWNQRASCPVVVNKGKRTWIEWKKFVNLGNGQSVAMSLKFNERKKQWQILKVIDCDAVRVYGQYLLLGNELIGSLEREWKYHSFARRINTRLDIV